MLRWIVQTETTGAVATSSGHWVRFSIERFSVFGDAAAGAAGRASRPRASRGTARTRGPALPQEIRGAGPAHARPPGAPHPGGARAPRGAGYDPVPRVVKQTPPGTRV